MRQKKIRGSTFVEVLVAAFLLASSLLGIAALQTQSIQYSNRAHLNSLASMLAYDMLDRIIANQVISIHGSGYISFAGSPPSSYPNQCDIANCSPEQMADYDIAQWKYLVNMQLPDSDGIITRTNSTVGWNYTISIFFDDSKGQENRRELSIRVTL